MGKMDFIGDGKIKEGSEVPVVVNDIEVLYKAIEKLKKTIIDLTGLLKESNDRIKMLEALLTAHTALPHNNPITIPGLSQPWPYYPMYVRDGTTSISANTINTLDANNVVANSPTGEYYDKLSIKIDEIFNDLYNPADYIADN